MTCRRSVKQSKSKRHLDKLASMSCVVCGTKPVEIHHPRLFSGALSKKCSDYLALPVCSDCHRGSDNGIHGNKNMWKVYDLDEPKALAVVIERLLYG